MDWESTEEIGNLVSMVRETVRAAALTTLSEQQGNSIQKPRAKGPIWAAKFSFPTQENNDAREAVLQVVDDFNHEGFPYNRPQAGPIDVEWIGYRKNVDAAAPEPAISETAKYEGLMKDTSNPGVIYILYGGAFYMNDQASYRKVNSKIAAMTGMRCVTVNQRLAPQSIFPAQLLDVFYGYLMLLSPPPGAPHAAVPASSIVLAGDSSGASLAMGLIQVLLQLRRKGITSLDFYGSRVELQLPAGVTLLSAVTDMTNSLPAYKSNAAVDIFPVGPPPSSQAGFPPCEIWPSKPPRGYVYCDVPMLYHPITAPVMAKDWTGSPPLWFVSGQEQILDGVKLVAQTAHRQGVSVSFQEYECMNHCFMWLFHEAPQTQKVWDDWAKTCTSLVKDGSIVSRAEVVQAKGLTVKKLDLENLSLVTREEAERMIISAAKKFTTFTGQAGVAKL